MAKPGLHDDPDRPPRGWRRGRHRRSRSDASTSDKARFAVESDDSTALIEQVELGEGSAGAAEVVVADATSTQALLADEPSNEERKKAGRNMPVAIGVGAALGAAVLIPLLFYRPAFVVVIAVGILVGIWELVRALTKAAIAHPPLPPLLIGGAGSVVAVWFAGTAAAVIGLLVTMVVVFLWRLPDGPVGFWRDITAAGLIAVYLPFLAGFVILLVAPIDGSWRVLAFIATTICSDIGGLLVGSLMGRHRMSPLVSPNKSWEGFAGSVLACALCGIVFFIVGLNGAWWQGALFGVAIAIAATLGDLAESLVKRDLGLKDMGTLLPAHGGFMDRFDSLLAAAPVAYVLLTLFTPAA